MKKVIIDIKIDRLRELLQERHLKAAKLPLTPDWRIYSIIKDGRCKADEMRRICDFLNVDPRELTDEPAKVPASVESLEIKEESLGEIVADVVGNFDEVTNRELSQSKRDIINEALLKTSEIVNKQNEKFIIDNPEKFIVKGIDEDELVTAEDPDEEESDVFTLTPEMEREYFRGKFEAMEEAFKLFVIMEVKKKWN